MKPFRSILLGALFAVSAATGCDTIIDVENLPARVTGIGPVDAAGIVSVQGVDTASQVRLYYTLRDDQGDDTKIFVEVCEAGGTACGVAFEGIGSDGTDRLPTAPYETDVSHQFRWAAACGRIVGEEIVGTDMTKTYEFRLAVLGSDEDPIVSPEFHLVDDLGFEPSLELTCER